MKKIPFLILVFMLTTGFFKSALEECADKSFIADNGFPQTETKSTKYSKAERDKMLFEHKKRKKLEIKKHYSLPICKNFNDIYSYPKICRNPDGHMGTVPYEEVLDRSFDMLLLSGKTVVVKSYTKSELEKRYKKFFKKSLKIKMDNNKYYKNYSGCVDYKKRSPELFKAKYD